MRLAERQRGRVKTAVCNAHSLIGRKRRPTSKRQKFRLICDPITSRPSWRWLRPLGTRSRPLGAAFRSFTSARGDKSSQSIATRARVHARSIISHQFGCQSFVREMNLEARTKTNGRLIEATIASDWTDFRSLARRHDGRWRFCLTSGLVARDRCQSVAS